MNRVSLKERRSTYIDKQTWMKLNQTSEFLQLQESGVVKASFTNTNSVKLSGTCYVGTAICNGIELNIEEKVPGALRTLLRHSLPRTFKIVRSRTKSSEDQALLSIVIENFVHSIKSYVSDGREFNYKNDNCVGSLVGGKLNITRSIQLRAKGMGHLLAFERQGISHRTDLNKCLLFTLSKIEKLAKQVNISNESLASARGLTMLFSDCRDIDIITRESSYFIDLANKISKMIESQKILEMLSLAQMIISGSGLGHSSLTNKDSPISWFINLEKLFEAAILAALQRNFPAGNVFHGETNPAPIFYNKKNSYTANPDIVITDSNSKSLSIGDVKYKNSSVTPDHSDIYQLIVHAQSYGSKHAFLVFPGEKFSHTEFGTTAEGLQVDIFSITSNEFESDILSMTRHIKNKTERKEGQDDSMTLTTTDNLA